ncbi:hypothetical protein C8F01DRAFT_1134319 [Mycena amicta]|nr:hypothetical protein C8F01DRAFT_1134319 [Mycena amicta]
MDDLPQELVDAIVVHVAGDDDQESLKACSLTSSAFRDPSQRALWRQITINPSTPTITQLPASFPSVSVDTAVRKLDETPHIARCVNTLLLPMGHAEEWLPERMAMLQRILEQLDGVTTVTIGGKYSHPGVLRLILAFCSRCPNGHLQNLTLATQVPHSFVLHLFSCAKNLFISRSYITPDNETGLPRDDVPPSILTDLTLSIYPTFYEFLALPESLARFPALERLSFALHHDRPTIMARACAHTLQRLDLNCTRMSLAVYGSESSVVFPPDMPSLRAVKFLLPGADLRRMTWLPATLSALLAHTNTPQLASIELRVSSASVPLPWRTTVTVSEELLPHLDGLLVHHVARPAVLWHLGTGVAREDLRVGFEAFEQCVRQGMPRAEEDGRLPVEPGA